MTSRNSAFVRSNIRKYGGCIEVKEPLPNQLQFQITDMRVLDPSELYETNVDYETFMKRDSFYSNAIAPEMSNDPSQAVFFGRTDEGNSICVRVPFRPYTFLYIPNVMWDTNSVRLIHKFLCRTLGLESEKIVIEPMMRKRLDGWIPDKVNQTKTEEICVLHVSVPNKKYFEKLIEVMDPTKSYEKILRGTMKKIRDELSSMAQYKYVKPLIRDRIIKNLSSIDGRLKFVRRGIENASKDPDDVSGSTSGYSFPPQQFDEPDLGAELTFQCNDANKLWIMWKEKRRCIYQNIAWWLTTGYKIRGLKSTLFPVLWETTVDFNLKFCDQTRITATGWMQINAYERPNGFISHAQIECLAKIANIVPVEKESIAPLLMASVDGEMYSNKSTTFPNPLKPDNPIITIGVVLCRTNSNEMERFVFCLNTVDESQVTNAKVFQFQSESKLLEAYRDFMVTEADPDFVTGYNILGFDWRYFAHRAAQTFTNKEIIAKLLEEESDSEEDEETEKKSKKTHAEEPVGNLLDDSSRTQIIGPAGGNPSRFFRLSRLWAEITPCMPKVFKSDAYGERWSYHFHMTGRATQDLLIYIRREHKLESYKLDNVSMHFLKDKKIDLDHKLLFKYYESGPKERGLIAEYCIKDCVLPIQLCKHVSLMVIQNLVGMSRVTYTFLPQLINGGQQIKVFNQLVWYAHLGGFVMNDQPHREVDGYEGATVLDPSPGWYDCPITVLDFASLYPSIIRNQNLCYSTIVRDPKYKNLPGVEYNIVKIGDREHTFVQSKILKGVLPILEENLLGARKRVKNLMKTEKDPDFYSMLNARQLALKVSANSVYGFTGAGNGMYPEPAIAESITATGRKFIEAAKEYVLSNHEGSDVIYGDTDSIFIKFAVPADETGLRKSFDLGREVAKEISKRCGEAMALEMEKVYFPLLLFGKKRYIGLKFEVPEKYKELDAKGVEIVRRDWSQLVRTIYNKCIHTIFFDRDVTGAQKALQNYCQDMIDNKLDSKWFVMSKELKSKYANPDSQVHVAVVKKIAQRSPGSEPQIGDRVPFVIVRTGKGIQKNQKTSEKSEDPEYALSHNIPLDYMYYLEKQIERPLKDFFTMFVDTQHLFSDVKRQLHNQYTGVGRNGLMAYMTSQIKSQESAEVENHPMSTNTDFLFDGMFLQESVSQKSTKEAKIQPSKPIQSAQPSKPIKSTKQRKQTKEPNTSQQNLKRHFSSRDVSDQTIPCMTLLPSLAVKSSRNIEDEMDAIYHTSSIKSKDCGQNVPTQNSSVKYQKTLFDFI